MNTSVIAKWLMAIQQDKVVTRRHIRALTDELHERTGAVSKTSGGNE